MIAALNCDVPDAVMDQSDAVTSEAYQGRAIGARKGKHVQE
jgi:hypothetical protein